MNAYSINNRRGISRWAVIAMLLLAFTWRIHNLSWQSLWRDEVDAIFFAVGDLEDLLHMFVRPGQNGPLYFLFLRPWFWLIGSSEFALRYPSTLFGVASIPLLWQIVWRINPVRNEMARFVISRLVIRQSLSDLWRSLIGKAALLSALFLALNPYQLWYGQEGKMYSLITLLTLIAVWFWLRGIGVGGWIYWFGFFVTVSVAMYSHLIMILLVPMFITWFFIAWPVSKRHYKGFALTLLGLSLPYVPILLWQWDFLIATEQITALEFVPFIEIAEALVIVHSVGIVQPIYRLWMAPILILVIGGTLQGYKVLVRFPQSSSRDISPFRRHLLIVSWLIVPLVGIYLLSLHQPVFLPRYIIWISPVAMILLALGINLIWIHHAIWSRILTILATVYMVVFWAGLGWQEKTVPYKTDLRSAVSFVSQRRQPDELLVLQIPHLEFAYRYYSGVQGTRPFIGSDDRMGDWVSGLWTNNHLDDEEAWRQVNQELRELTTGESAVWLILSEEEMWDKRGLMESWFNQHAAIGDEENFYGVRVKYYRMR